MYCTPFSPVNYHFNTYYGLIKKIDLILEKCMKVDAFLSGEVLEAKHVTFILCLSANKGYSKFKIILQYFDISALKYFIMVY